MNSKMVVVAVGLLLILVFAEWHDIFYEALWSPSEKPLYKSWFSGRRMRIATFQLSEFGGSVNGPNLF